jgi:hypothetical protein
MPLNTILEAMDSPVKPEMMKDIIQYMKGMPAVHETLVLQCAAALDKDPSLKTILAIAYALNEGEVLLTCRDDDLISEHDLAKEFDKLMGDGK